MSLMGDSPGTIWTILERAAWGASRGNLQPWNVVAVTGEARRCVIETVRNARQEHTRRPIFRQSIRGLKKGENARRGGNVPFLNKRYILTLVYYFAMAC